MISTDTSLCIHCHKCRDNCTFLSQYGIDIGDTTKLRELAYHCFLCGTCTAVCPAEIDGRGVVMELRKERTEDGSSPAKERGYKSLLWEKRDYRFKNYRHATPKSVLFPGCNFPSMYPKTMKYLAGLLMEEAGIGTVYDCCGKPIAELGLSNDEDRIISSINKRMKDAGVTEVITVCPNCFDYLKDRIDAKTVSIYDKLAELGLGSQIEGGRALFMPCPERFSDEGMLSSIEQHFAVKPFKRISGVQCCGLGGSASVSEPDLAREMIAPLVAEKELWVYCATCAGRITRSGGSGVRHVLTAILGTDEKPDTGKSMVNRALTKIR